MTPSLPKVAEMSDEEMNRAIAEALGWRREREPRFEGAWKWTDPKGGYAGTFYHPEMPDGRRGVPDYCRDLNAMQSAFETLTDDQKFACGRALQDVLLMAEGDAWITWATAKQRAQAFLLATGRARA